VIVDAHVHLWRLARGDNLALSPSMTAIYRDMEPPDLKPHLDSAGVDRVVVVQAAETLAETLFTMGLARRFPWIAGIVAWVDPASAAIEEEVAALAWNPIVKGARPVRDDNLSIAWMLDRRLDRGWRAMADNGLALDILVQNWREIPLATALVRAWPELTIVLDHCGKPDVANGALEPWATSIRELAGLPNVACKFSGLLNCALPGAAAEDLRPYAFQVFESFTASRVMWASDWPPLELAAGYETWIGISQEILTQLSAHEIEQVMAGTAARIYRLAL
jgi:L-fuconolactonase